MANPLSNPSPVVREVLWLAIALAIGATLVPIGVYTVGRSVLGAYGDGGGLFAFWADYFVGLAQLGLSQWLLFLGPFVLISLARLLVRFLRNV